MIYYHQNSKTFMISIRELSKRTSGSLVKCLPLISDMRNSYPGAGQDPGSGGEARNLNKARQPVIESHLITTSGISSQCCRCSFLYGHTSNRKALFINFPNKSTGQIRSPSCNSHRPTHRNIRNLHLNRCFVNHKVISTIFYGYTYQFELKFSI